MAVTHGYPTLSLHSNVPRNSYDLITIMEGPEIHGLDRFWLGEYAGEIRADDDTLIARPVSRRKLPHPMTLPEVQDWALEHLPISAEAIAEHTARKTTTR